jgi:hypothetical protein
MRAYEGGSDIAAIFRHEDDSGVNYCLVNGLNVGPARDGEAVILFHAFYGEFGHTRLR